MVCYLFGCTDLSREISKRLSFCSGSLSKPRPVPVGKLYKINLLITLMSRHHCLNILLAVVPLLTSFSLMSSVFIQRLCCWLAALCFLKVCRHSPSILLILEDPEVQLHDLKQKSIQNLLSYNICWQLQFLSRLCQ